MNKYYFVSVNYNSSGMIQPWFDSIKRSTDNFNCIVVDNFYSEMERSRTIKICQECGIEIINSENIGYGRALNKAIKYLISKNCSSDNDVVFAGNLDIQFENVSISHKKRNVAYIPFALEKGRNRNPFLTKIQKRLLSFHKITLKTQSTLFMKFVIMLIKIGGLIPSSTWAVHGSLFCFELSIVQDGENIFNEDSFLYSEELEFASYLDSKKIELVKSQISYNHTAHVSTGNLTKNFDSFIKIWSPSFANWIKRWS